MKQLHLLPAMGATRTKRCSHSLRPNCERMEDRFVMSTVLPDVQLHAALLASSAKPQQPALTATAISPTATMVPMCPWVIDHPGTNGNGTYKVINGTVFGSGGPKYTDVHQGGIGDCWLLSSLAEAASRAPRDITRMFTDLGAYMENGVKVECYSVQFYDKLGRAHSVIADNELPVNSSGQLVYDQVYGSVLWVALAEKAYIQADALGYVQSNTTNINTYNNISNGAPTWALSAITGHPASYATINITTIDQVFRSGNLVVLVTGATTTSSLIVPGHAYALIGDTCNVGSMPYTIYNPWGLGSYVTYAGHQVYGGTFYCNGAFVKQNWVQEQWALA